MPALSGSRETNTRERLLQTAESEEFLDGGRGSIQDSLLWLYREAWSHVDIPFWGPRKVYTKHYSSLKTQGRNLSSLFY